MPVLVVVLLLEVADHHPGLGQGVPMVAILSPELFAKSREINTFARR
jgi:hypothetical protein